MKWKFLFWMLYQSWIIIFYCSCDYSFSKINLNWIVKSFLPEHMLCSGHLFYECLAQKRFWAIYPSWCWNGVLHCTLWLFFFQTGIRTLKPPTHAWTKYKKLKEFSCVPDGGKPGMFQSLRSTTNKNV